MTSHLSFEKKNAASVKAFACFAPRFFRILPQRAAHADAGTMLYGGMDAFVFQD